MNHIMKSCRQDLLDIYKCAVDAVKPESLIRRSVAFRDGKLVIKDPVGSGPSKEFDLTEKRIHVIGGGKCVLGMAKGLAGVAIESQTASLFSHGCLSVPIQSKASFKKDINIRMLMNKLNISVMFGAKDNLPDENSIRATDCILKAIKQATYMDSIDKVGSIFLVLLSGGGSACLSSPKDLPLKEKLELIRILAQRGASIDELNTVRGAYSYVKRGGLARAIHVNNPNSQLIALIISDVIDDPIDTIAGGPTYIDNAKDFYGPMESICRKYEVRIQDGWYINITERPEMDVDRFVCNRVIGNNEIALDSIVRRASELGYSTTSLGNDLSGTTSDVLKKILDTRVKVATNSEKSLIVAGGETTVIKGPGESWGLGGRVQEMALDYMLHVLPTSESLDDINEQNRAAAIDLFMACSTDGQDGPTNVAACMASLADWSTNRTFTMADAREAKRAHDSYNFWTKHMPDWLIKKGPTGTNVMDLYMLISVNPSSPLKREPDDPSLQGRLAANEL